MIREQEIYLIGKRSINEMLPSNIATVLETAIPNFCRFQ